MLNAQAISETLTLTDTIAETRVKEVALSESVSLTDTATTTAAT